MVTPMKASDINSNAQEKIDAEILMLVEGLIGNKQGIQVNNNGVNGIAPI
jgi:hypothetical protein